MLLILHVVREPCLQVSRPKYEATLESELKSFYVDDFLKSVTDKEQALILAKEQKSENLEDFR